MAGGFHLFGTLAKIEEQDDGSIKVFGIASSGARDEAGELITPDAMKAALPDYALYPALREMHGLSAAGRTLEADVDEDGMTRIVAHVVDPIAVAKVKSKTYAGFSIGGKVLARDPTDRTIITKLKLNEISLVDRPCNPEAAIDLWKADGALETTIMAAAPTNDDVKARAEEMAKAAGKPGRGKDYVVKAREALAAEAVAEVAEPVEDEVVAKTDAEPDGDPAEALAEVEPTEVVIECAADADPVSALAVALAKATAAGAETPVSTSSQRTEGLAEAGQALTVIAKSAEADPLAKGLYTVSRLADVLQDLAYIQSSTAWEAEAEGDASPVPQELATAIQGLGATLVNMAREEVAELLADMTERGVELVLTGDGAVVELAAGLVDLVKADVDLMEKAGARHSKADMAKLQGMHDGTVALGAKCSNAVTKTEDGDDLTKVQTEVERLTKALTEAAPQVEALAKRLDDQAVINADLKKRLEQVENEPAMPRTAASARAVTKAEDVAGPAAGDLAPEQVSKAAMETYLAGLPDDERALVLTKAALRLPIRA